MSCPSLEAVAAWLLSDSSEAEQEAFEEHYFGCQACWARVQRLERTLQVLSRGMPVTLTRARHDALVAREPLPMADVQPSGRATLRLSRVAPAGVWVMHFSEPSVARVDLQGRSSSGQVLFGLLDVAFDAEQRRVYMPCHLHYQHSFGGQDSTLVVELRAVDPGGAQRKLGEYILDHEFESL
jgi:anti-sigma factor RsiW